MGKKAYERGYELPLPFGLNVGTIFNRQGLVLDDFEMAIADPNSPEADLTYRDLSGILDFGPSEGRINTLNIRGDAFILPFLAVGGYYGRVWGEQSISFSVVGSDYFKSTTDIKGQYYGLSLLGLIPLGPVVLSADYSWSWTTNKNLDKPVLVKVSGLRLIRRILTNKENRYFAVWAGVQFQNLDNRSSGNIRLDEALGISEEDKMRLEDHWEMYTNNEVPNGRGEYWSDLTLAQRLAQQAAYDLVKGVADDNVFYKFNKRLEYDYSMLLGLNYQHNAKWQFRSEYGFLKTKQQLMIMATYRFGL
ncbi:hypothetical protein KZP23_07685 [Echinicola marina]|uniref:hypothetical protein n=1 Tax=Echinicola marina TaxID=2859768 RepID=UPI001CF681CF|nr:hypothetical protein [Echinicola marina]UCS94882.1 hypothetical protein KZP23_07685 [Echinicola marina]